jgi:hypothetical protein
MTFTRTALAMAIGPIAWAAHFLAIYGFTGVACARGLGGWVPAVIGLATLVAGSVCAWAIVAGLRERDAFERWLSAMLAAAALVAIVWEALPALWLTPCA